MLTVMCGVPGAGKTTWARRWPDVELVSDVAAPADVWKQIEDWRYGAVARFLGARADVIVDGCHLLAARRAPWLELARRAGTPARLVIVDVNENTAIARNAARHPAQRVPAVRMARCIAMARSMLPVALRLEHWDLIEHVDGEAAEEDPCRH